METLSMWAYAKINFTLDITGKRADGYHLLKTVMQQISVSDRVTVKKKNTGISLNSGSAQLSNDEGNLAYRAASLFFQETGIVGGVQIDIEKNIPIEAGLAGGSTDAAAVLLLLNRLYEKNLPLRELCEIGVKLGADVPFCIVGGVADCRGIGEEITPLKAREKMNLVLVKPDYSLSTGKIYALTDTMSLSHPAHEDFLDAWEKGTLEEIAGLTGNIMEQASMSVRPEIREVLNDLMKEGAMVSRMSGSGPSVYGIFADEAGAKLAAERLKPKYPETFYTSTVI